jgi:hypothetical protein
MQNQKYKQEKADSESSKKKKFSNQPDEGYEDEVIDEVIDLPNNQNRLSKPDPLATSDPLAGSGISSSGANAIDHSIDTL